MSVAPPSVRRRHDCRLCGGGRHDLVLSLTPTPPANAFVPEAALSEPQPTFPLDVFFCLDCGHVQLLDVVDPAHLFRHYVYVSGTSPVTVAHNRDYAAEMAGRVGVPAGGLVVDIGSNDGTLLQAYKDRGFRVLGVDPARNLAQAATERGIPTLAEFFTAELGRRIRDEHGPAAIVTANNVFAHIDDLRGVAEGVRALLAPDGIFAFEVSYLVDVYEKTLFDTIYHEHLDYHSVKPLRSFFPASGLELTEAFRVAAQGGSLRGIARPAASGHGVGASVAELVALEERLGLDRVETLRRYGRRIDAVRDELGALLRRLKGEGRRIAAYGAPAKATTLMHHFGIGPETVEFIADDNPLKQGLYTPGLHVPVVPTEEIYRRRPDVLVILAWNFAEPIMAKHSAFRDAGGRFVVPLPRVVVS